MKFTVTYATNFLRVFRLPDKYPSDYCFGGGHPVTMIMVDWFNAFSPLDFCSDTIKEYEETDELYLKHIKELRDYIASKSYFHPLSTYLVLTDYGDAFIVNPQTRATLLQKEHEQIIEQSQEKSNGD